MKSFFVICFLVIFALGADDKINWLSGCSRNLNISIAINIANDEVTDEKYFGVEKAPPHSFPYEVGLVFRNSSGIYGCGGVLIATEYILTVARCADKMDSVVVFLGALSIDKGTDAEVRIKVPKSNFIIHKEWNKEKLANDIALIRLPSAIKLTKEIQLVNLPPRSLSNSKLEGKHVTVSGWGKYTYTYSPLLHYVKLKVISEKQCKRDYKTYIHETHICTNNDGKPNCMGCSGDPLVFEQPNGSKTLIGILSFVSSAGCAIGWPTVFTNIRFYLDWISSNTGLSHKTDIM